MEKYMYKFIFFILLLCWSGVSFANPSFQMRAVTGKPRTLIVFFDGLRPDYITPRYMPNLYRLRNEGCLGKEHHSVYPTMTRVNASSYSTGAYPAEHGIMSNEVYFPDIDRAHSLNTAGAEALDRISSARQGQLLTAKSLGEMLESAGERMMVFSDGSQGQAYLQNHAISGGAIVNTEFIRPAAFRSVVENAIGQPPPFEELNRPRHKWITDALLTFGLVKDGPLVNAIWYADPDETAHAEGVGAPLTLQALSTIDNELGRILQAIEERQLTDSINIIISTDHGFITRSGTEWPQDFLIRQNLKKDKDSDDVVLADGAIYVKGHDRKKIEQIVAALQAQPWVGGIFTKALKPGSTHGWVKGTLSFASIHWDHPDRAADILVADYWDDAKNEQGYAGTSYYGGKPASHGGFSRYEVHIALIAKGPSFKKAQQSDIPTSNADIAPTILNIYDIPVPQSMSGRVMYEFLNNTHATMLPAVQKEKIITSAPYNGGVYNLTLQRTIVGKYIYLDFAKVVRTKTGK
ncbi:MAG: alkaline phosphatase family protein [Sphingobacteriales bacterium 44-15]|nr:MAG: alkaline phosphatase family protein [Sphingobacteriales bacterium 44-15]